MTSLTKAEEQVMQALWAIGQGYLKDLHEAMPAPKPAYTTVATVVRVLVKKGAIGFETHGKVHSYFPIFSKEAYSKGQFQRIVRRFFDNSFQQFASFFAKDEALDLATLEEMKKTLEAEIAKRKKEEEL